MNRNMMTRNDDTPQPIVYKRNEPITYLNRRMFTLYFEPISDFTFILCSYYTLV